MPIIIYNYMLCIHTYIDIFALIKNILIYTAISTYQYALFACGYININL